jgi:ribose/xylose/arabinose/galactoside ABC-type transport system permease subunit
MSAEAGPLTAVGGGARHVRTVLVVVIVAAIALFLWVNAPSFYRFNNLINVLVQSSSLAVLCIGMAVVMIGGGIDLSLPANMALSAILGGFVMAAGNSPWAGCAVMLLTGSVIGTLNGVAVAYLKMIPFVVTLATMTVVGGLSVWLTNSTSVSGFPESFFDVMLARPGGVPTPVFIAALTVLVVSVVMSSTMFGRHVYAAGISPKAAEVARVPVERTLLMSYGLAGFCGGLTAILLSARLGSASANMGVDSVVLDIVSAVVVGGISIYGGVGRIWAAALGAVFITLLSNSLNQLGASFYLSLVIKGVVIIAFIALDTAFRSRR